MDKTIYINADDFGRSEIISKNILKTIDLGMINSVSIMVNHNKKIYETLKSRKVKKKLHINLTDFSPNHKFEKNELILKKLTFFKLMFLKKKQREVVFNEIERQINLYVDYFKVSEIIVDGHQHIHVIPWIYNYLIRYENIKIVEIRLPKEKFFIGDIKTFFKLKFYRNLIAYLLLNIIITSSFLNLKFQRKYPSFEIAFHPGYTTEDEQNEFYDLFFKYYSSKERKEEFSLALKKLI